MDISVYLKVALLILLTVTCSEAKKKKKKSKAKKKPPSPQYYLMNFCDWTFNMYERHLDEVLFGLTSSGVHGAGVDCQMQVMTSPGRQLSFKVLEMNLQDCHDSVAFYNGNSTDHSDAMSPKLCSKTRDSYKTSDSKGVVRFQANGSVGTFLILVTSFYISEGTCMSGDFSCGNGLCIREKLYCNERDNCGDNSDEPDTCGKDERWWLPIPCVIGGFTFLIMFMSLMKRKARKKEADAKKKEEEKKKADEKKKEEEKKKTKFETNKETASNAMTPRPETSTDNDVITDPPPVQGGNPLRLEPELDPVPAPMMGAWEHPAPMMGAWEHPAPMMEAWEHPAPTSGTKGEKSEKQQLESSFPVWTSSVPRTTPSMNSVLYMPTMLPPPYTELPMTNLPNLYIEQQVNPDPGTFISPMDPARVDESRSSGTTLSRPRSN